MQNSFGTGMDTMRAAGWNYSQWPWNYGVRRLDSIHKEFPTMRYIKQWPVIF